MTKVIQFPGAKAPEQDKKPLPSDQKPVMPVDLNADQQKAIGIIMSGATFVCVGIKNTNSGADFFTACHGDEADLRNAEDHLPAVIRRLFVKKGIVS